MKVTEFFNVFDASCDCVAGIYPTSPSTSSNQEANKMLWFGDIKNFYIPEDILEREIDSVIFLPSFTSLATMRIYVKEEN